LHSVVTDMRSGKPAKDLGFTEDDVFVTRPWTSLGKLKRRMLWVNAYNGTDFTRWYQGPHSHADNTRLIAETVARTLGTPEGSKKALEGFSNGVDEAIERIIQVENKRECADAVEDQMTYTYLYTAHPDKHMHALGVEHSEVAQVVNGLDKEIARLWEAVKQYDVALIVTADHGHVTVEPSNMVTLPDEVLECLEYANVGIHGKGRHAYLHVRSGRRQELEARWARCSRLREGFLLLTLEDAIDECLFGPDAVLSQVRPRLGDYIAISIGADTLVTPDEATKWRDCERPCCQGAHGSLNHHDMRIPFVLCTPQTTP